MATENDLAQAPRNSRVGEADPKSEFSSNPLDVLLNDPSTPKEVRQVMGAFMRMGPVPPPHLSKITPEHITQFIESTERDSQREHEREKWAYWFSGFCMAFESIPFLVENRAAPWVVISRDLPLLNQTELLLQGLS